MYFFFNDTATTEIYTLSLHDALPISLLVAAMAAHDPAVQPFDQAKRTQHQQAHHAEHQRAADRMAVRQGDRKSTRLNSSHQIISYAVFCLKKKKENKHHSHK